MRSTHACTPSFATFFANIHVGCCLFSHNQKSKTNKKNKLMVFLVLDSIIYFFVLDSRVIDIKCAQLCNKKNAEHTRMYTNFRSFLLNIHVGCCLFSHNLKYKKNQTQKVSFCALLLTFFAVRPTIFELVFLFFYKDVLRTCVKKC